MVKTTEPFNEGCIVMCIEILLKQEPTRLMVEALNNRLYIFFLIQYCKNYWNMPGDQSVLQKGAGIFIDRFTSKSDWRFETARERYNLMLEHHPEIIKRAPLCIASCLNTVLSR